MNEKTFNLYEDEPDNRSTSNNPEQTSGDLVSNTTIVYLNFNDELPDLIKPIRTELEDKPEGFKLNIYIVCGNNCNKDIPLFLDYIISLEEVFDFTFFLRGIIHSEFISILNKEKVFVERNCKLIYRQEKLHLLLKNLIATPALFKKFMQRFIDDYSKFPTETFIDLTELETIGFQVAKFPN